MKGGEDGDDCKPIAGPSTVTTIMPAEIHAYKGWFDKILK